MKVEKRLCWVAFFQCIQRYINYFHEAVFESKIKKEEC